MSEEKRALTLRDRPEFRHKPKPLTLPLGSTVAAAVAAMADKNFGSVLITTEDGTLTGIVTERDILKRLVHAKKDAENTLVEDIMTSEPRVAREDDEMLDWLRTMSNERFRRLPVVDDAGRAIAVFTQGDFVSYTWPDLIYQAKELIKAKALNNFPVLLLGGGIAFYTIVMALIFRSI